MIVSVIPVGAVSRAPGLEGLEGLRGLEEGDNWSWITRIGESLSTAWASRIANPPGTFRTGPEGTIISQAPGYPVPAADISARVGGISTGGIMLAAGVGLVALVVVMSMKGGGR